MSGVNPRDLIHEIKIRPGIYDRDALVPPRLEHKHRLWLEVAARLTPSEDWESYTDVEKDARIDEIAAKWKHVKANFHRDVKLEEAGEAHKKRKYIYFKEMEFMRPFIGIRLPPYNKRGRNSIDSLDCADDLVGNETDIDMDAFLKSSDSVEDVASKVTIKTTPVTEGRKSKRLIKPTAKAMENKITSPVANRVQKEVIVKNAEALKKTEVSSNPSFKIRDGDISFCLSLVPTLRKLGDGRKLRAKIEILKVLHRYVDHIERRNLIARSNVSNHQNIATVNQNQDVEDDMAEDHLEEYEEGVIIKNEEHDDPLNGNSGNTKTWWT